jgi:cbb3-type cytochrome oxidase maturation protein
MTILLLLIPISLLLLGVGVWAFIWAVRKGQFDNLETPALDILREDPLDHARAAPSAAASEPQRDAD